MMKSLNETLTGFLQQYELEEKGNETSKVDLLEKLASEQERIVSLLTQGGETDLACSVKDKAQWQDLSKLKEEMKTLEVRKKDIQGTQLMIQTLQKDMTDLCTEGSAYDVAKNASIVRDRFQEIINLKSASNRVDVEDSSIS